MNFPQAIKVCFNKYATFSGRASRSEFWYWRLFIAIGTLIAMLLDKVVFQASSNWGLLHVIFEAIIFLPSINLDIRRLHDVNRSGWWMLILFTIIGVIFPWLYWDCKKGTTGINRFGADPLIGA